MRNFAVFLSLALALVSSFAHATSTSVFYFNGQTHRSEIQTIPKLKDIIDLVSAGHYAWAYSTDHTIAFYNGKEWTPAVFITGMLSITGVYPGFPVNGKQAIAWITGTNEADERVVAFFDGQSYSRAQKTDVVQIDTSGGYAWGYSGFDKPIRMTSWQQPTLWRDVPNSTMFSDKEAMLSSTAFNDNEAAYYILSFGIGGTETTLKKIDENGNITTVLNDLNHQAHNLFVQNDDIVVFSPQEYRLSRDNGLTWKTVPESISYVFDTQYANGIICDVDAFNPVKCIDNNANPPSKRTFALNNYDPQEGYQTNTDATGFWVSTTNNNIPFISHYNFITGTQIDTQVSAIASEVANIRAMNSSQVLACGLDKKNKPVALYYDGTNWTATLLPSDPDTCDFEETNVADTADKSVWIYETTTEDNDSADEKVANKKPKLSAHAKHKHIQRHQKLNQLHKR